MSITPSGVLRARKDTRVLVRASYLLEVSEARIVYNEQESSIVSAVSGRKADISIGSLMVSTTGRGSNGTHRLFQFDFTLLPLLIFVLLARTTMVTRPTHLS